MTSHLLELLSLIRQKITNVAEEVGKREPLFTTGRNVNWFSHNRKSMKDPQSLKNKTTIWPSNSTFEYISKGNENRISKRYLHPHVYCSIIHNIQGIEVSVNRWMDKEKVVFAYNGILFSHKTDILPFATTWMDLEDIVLSEVSQRDKFSMISLISRM